MQRRRSRNGRSRSYRSSRGKAASIGRRVIRRARQARKTIRRGFGRFLPGARYEQRFYEYISNIQYNDAGVGVPSVTHFSYKLENVGTPILAPETSRFRYYRIKRVYLRFDPTYDKALITTSLNTANPEIWTVVDRNPATIPGNFSSTGLLSIPGAKRHSPFKTFYHSFKPSIQNLVAYSVGSQYDVVPSFDDWIPTESTGLAQVYNGLRIIWINPTPQTPNRQIFNMHVRYLVEFKDPVKQIFV